MSFLHKTYLATLVFLSITKIFQWAIDYIYCIYIDTKSLESFCKDWIYDDDDDEDDEWLEFMSKKIILYLLQKKGHLLFINLFVYFRFFIQISSSPGLFHFPIFSLTNVLLYNLYHIKNCLQCLIFPQNSFSRNLIERHLKTQLWKVFH